MYLQFQDMEELKEYLKTAPERYSKQDTHVLVGFEFYTLKKDKENWTLTSFRSARET